MHPDDAYAAEHEDGSLGKKECWYVLSAEPGGTIIVGQRARSREEFAQMVEAGRWDELVYEIPVHAGDFFQIVRAVHAVKGGTVILETQQSTTSPIASTFRSQRRRHLRELPLLRLDVAPRRAAGIR